MDNLLYKVSLKYALIAIGFSLISSIPYLFGLDPEVIMGLSVLLMIIGIIVNLVIYVSAILEFSKKKNHRCNTGEVFGLVGIIAGIIFIFGIIWTMVIYNFFMPQIAGGGDMMPTVTTGILSSFSVLGCMGFVMAIAGLQIAGMWRTVQKAGKEGWEVIVPLYNYIVFSEVGKNPSWWGIMLLIPVANIVFIILILNGVAKAFGKDGGYTVGLFFLGFIFWPLLAWGDASYQHGNFDSPHEAPDVSDHLVD